MVDFRGFSAAFNATYRSLSEDFNDRERLKLAKNEDARAASRLGMEQADRAAEDAYFNNTSVADKAALPTPAPASSPTMAAPNMLGGMTETGEPIPVGPDGRDPAQDEVAETAVARTKGIDVPPPAKVGAAPQSRDSALPASGYKGRVTPAIARDMREREQQKYDRQFKEKDFSERQRVNDSNIKLQQTNIDERSFDLMQKKLKFLNDGITAKIQDLDGIDDTTSVNDPKISGKVKSLITDFETFHKETLDGKYVKVKPVDGGYEVTEYDQETDAETGGQFVKSVGELRNFGRMTGVMAQGENLGTYTAGVMGDRLAKTIAANKQISEVAKLESNDKIGQFLDRKALANPETRKQLEADAIRLAAQIGDDAYDVVEKIETDPDTGKQTKIRVRENKFIKMMQLATPSSTIQTPKGTISADMVVKQAAADPQKVLQMAGSIDNVAPMLMQQMLDQNFPPETAEFYAQQAAAAVVQATRGALQKAATPASPSNAVPKQGAPAAPPASGLALPTRPINPRNPSQKPMSGIGADGSWQLKY